MIITHGVSVNWGVDSTIIGVNGAFQSRDHNYKVESKEIMNGADITVSKSYWNPKEEASFTYVAVQAVTNFSNATVDVPFIGGWITVVDPRYTRIAGNWLVDDIDISNSNTTSVRVVLKISRYPNVSNVNLQTGFNT